MPRSRDLGGAAVARRAMSDGFDNARRAMSLGYDNDSFRTSSGEDSISYSYQNQPLTERYFSVIVIYIYIYYIPLLIALGSIGNLVSVFVFYSSKLRLQSTSQYLSALAISDTLFLFQLLPPWLNAVNKSDLFYEEVFCKMFMYVTYVTCSLSAWLVVAFTVERFVAVLYPLQRNAICTVNRARNIICTIVVASLLLNVPVLRFVKGTSTKCDIDDEYKISAARFNLVDTIATFSVPLTVIIIMNTWIMIVVCRLERVRQQLRAETMQPFSRQGSHSAKVFTCPRSQKRVTRMLLIVSSVFVILNMPAYAMRMLAYAYEKNGDDNHGRWAVFQTVAQMFFYTNFGINFILYCLTGQNFRHALQLTIPWLRNRARRRMADRLAASCHPARTCSISTSFLSNCTEATTNYQAAVRISTATLSMRRRRRKTFGNHCQHLQSLAASAPTSPAVDFFELRTFPAVDEV